MPLLMKYVMIDDVSMRCFVVLMSSEPINFILNHFGWLGD